MRWLLFRLWSAVVGIIMISLSLLVQLPIFMMLSAILVPLVLPNANLWAGILAFFVLFNGVCFFEYFRKRRVATLGGAVHKLAGLVQPRSSHLLMVLFLVPRGIDRIVTGRELTGKPPAEPIMMRRRTQG
jgi:hypothetical protein